MSRFNRPLPATSGCAGARPTRRKAWRSADRSCLKLASGAAFGGRGGWWIDGASRRRIDGLDQAGGWLVEATLARCRWKRLPANVHTRRHGDRRNAIRRLFDPSVAATLNQVATAEDALCRQRFFVAMSGKQAVDEIPELLVRQTTLFGHSTQDLISDVGASSAMGSFGPNASLHSALCVIGKSCVVAFMAGESFAFESRLYIATLQRHCQRPNLPRICSRSSLASDDRCAGSASA